MIKKYYYILGCLLCIYGKNQYIDLLICCAIAIFLISRINKEDIFYLYFGLIFFEPILNLPFIGGSIFRIYQLIFFIKIMLDLKNNNNTIHVKNLSFICGLVLIITGFLYQNITSNISTIINVLLIIYSICKNVKSPNFFKNLLCTISIMIFFTAMYGFFNGSEFNYGSFVRKTTTISDPNYSALFLSIGIFCTLGNTNFSKKEKSLILFVLFTSLFLTVSLTGIIGTLIFFLLYLSINNFKKNIKYLILILTFVLLFLYIPFKPGNMLYGIQNRILNIEGSSANEISSGRIDIATKYIQQFFELPLKDILFGGNNTIQGEYREYCINKIGNVSHNSYIDMIYMTGIIGTTVILLYFILGIYYCYVSYKKNNNIAINYMFIKLIIMYYCMTISFFPYRYFIIFYILNGNKITKKGENYDKNIMDS